MREVVQAQLALANGNSVEMHLGYATVIMRDRLVLRYETNKELQKMYCRYLRHPPLIRSEILKLGVRQDRSDVQQWVLNSRYRALLRSDYTMLY